MTLSQRARIVERRTYLRPIDETDGQTVYETPDQAIDRQIRHQRWLWQRAKAGMVRDWDRAALMAEHLLFVNKQNCPWKLTELTAEEEAELEELRGYLTRREATLAGRTRWLGGTEVSRTREASQFNCSFLEVRTVHDVVDVFWLLLQGCGVGFRPVVGTLNGFGHFIPAIDVIQSIRGAGDKGRKENRETWDPQSGVWTIQIGDSAEAWAKAVGKLVAGKYKARKLVLDFSEIRGPGGRLKGYGWVCSGYGQLATAMQAIAHIFNKRAGQLLTRIDILDIINHLGTTLSSRRSSQIALMPYGDPEWEDFASAKKDYYLHEDRRQRAQSNNSLMFYHKPTRYQLRRLFKLMEESGGSEPGFYNAEEARRRAAYFKGTNPCGEILLGDKSFCNLVEIDAGKFNGREEALWRCVDVLARANYRQTCVNLDDGVLQRAWHEMNEFLRLCGVGITGIVRWEHHMEPEAWQVLRRAAQQGADSMADELGMPRPKLTTTIKPSGTASKSISMEGDEVTEGVHKPLGRFIFNWVIIPKADELTSILKDAGYRYIPHPADPTAEIFCLPVEYSNIKFDRVEKTVWRKRPKMVSMMSGEAWKRGGDFNGNEPLYLHDGAIPSQLDEVSVPEQVAVEINTDSAVSQLERYKVVMENYVDHNCSITVSYGPDEVPDIIDWIADNWSSYVGVSFLYRTDPSKTAADLGHPYLPQEVVDEQTYREYVATLRPFDLEQAGSGAVIELESCAGGACPIR